MWRSEQDAGAPSGGSSASNHATPEIPTHHVGASAFQHPTHNPTPFSTFPAAWVIGTAAVPDGSSLPSRSSSNPPGSIVRAPSDLLPNGLLTTPPPSTPATQLLKVLVNNRITIPVQDASYSASNGPFADSPATSGGPTIRPLDSLVLPSPSLLPGGVHSLPTPTSASSQPAKPIDGYGSRGSPLETASSKDSIPGPSAEHSSGSAKGPSLTPRPTSSAGFNRRSDAALIQNSSRNGSGASSGSSGVAGPSRIVDSSSSAGTSGSQYSGPRHPQPVAGAHHSGYAGVTFHHGHGMHHNGGSTFQLSQQPQAPLTATAVTAGAVSQAPGSPTVGYSAPPYYMAQIPPGAVVMGVHHAGSTSAGSGSGNGIQNRPSIGGSGVSREGSAGSGWRGSRSAGGSGAGSGSAGSGHGGKHTFSYGAPQQIMHGHMAQDGSAGPYGMPHMPYPVYGMMAPGIVMPQVISPVVGSPGSMEPHGPLGHQPVHMGPMIMSHGPSMTMGMGIGHHMHSFPPHGHMGGPPMGMHPHPHVAAHSHGGGFSHHHGPHFHGGPGMGGGYGHGQLTYSHSVGPPMHPHGAPYGSSSRGIGGKSTGTGTGSSHTSSKAARSGGISGGSGGITAGGGEANSSTAPGGGAASSITGSARDSPLAGRGRLGGREKADGKGRSAEQRERKPGNSRAPAVIAHCVTDMSALEEQLQSLVRQLTPGEDDLAAHQVALTAVKELVEGHWPHVKVHLFGSAANGLIIAGSNEIDITIEVPDMAWDDHSAKAAMVSELGELASGVSGPAAIGAPGGPGTKSDAAIACDNTVDTAPADAAEVAQAAAGAHQAAGGPAVVAVARMEGESSAVERAEGDTEATAEAATEEAAAEVAGERMPPVMTAVSALPKARTPIVKMTVISTQTRVEVTINNLLAISNTCMLRDYCEIDPRLRQLALLVKHWARTRSVNDAYRGSLSSYAYVLLCIWLLQQRQPAILPVLQQCEPHTYDKMVGPWRCSYNDRVEELKDFGIANKETLAELLVAFFDHWAWRHDYNGSVVCVRTGGTMAKSTKEWTKRQGNERHLMCVEDPFELSHDLGRTIDKAAVQVLRREFERAARIFASNPDPLVELLAPLTPEEEAAVAAALQSRRKVSKDKERLKDKQAAAAAAAAAAATSTGDADSSAAEAGTFAAEGADNRPALADLVGLPAEEQDSDDEAWSGNGQFNCVGQEPIASAPFTNLESGGAASCDA
ncbi:hypothetical protein Vafri_8659 [Volvox africanus]|uniref:PAP-associated domain-containing protein n=1 Tax=Volvox africanus TaxID=51714 RepID=A0A8J4EY61_9CHLO|nr:hypothetical protein Vafri_8659 [Volvox africanus]